MELLKNLEQLELSKMSELEMQELTHDETSEISGGVWWLPAALVVGLVVSAVNNFGDIREGIVDGWNGTPRH